MSRAPSIWNWPPSSRGCPWARQDLRGRQHSFLGRDALLRAAGERGCRAHLARGHERIRGASLDHIQFLDAELGWTSGQVLSPLPQDPFLLLTSDGGKTWRQRVIFSESRVGSIQQFHFSAKDSGSLIVDRGPGSEGGRYELYESPDAGETWTIRRNQRPAVAAEALAGGAALRVAGARRWPHAVVPPRAPPGRALGPGGRILREARGLPAVKATSVKGFPRIGRRVEWAGSEPARQVYGTRIALPIYRDEGIIMMVATGLAILVVFCLLLSMVETPRMWAGDTFPGKSDTGAGEPGAGHCAASARLPSLVDSVSRDPLQRLRSSGRRRSERICRPVSPWSILST